jgi:hypothetical protein
MYKQKNGHIDRETGRDRWTQTKRQIENSEKCMGTQIDTQTERQLDTQTERQLDTQTKRQIDSQTNGQANRKVDGQTD